MARRIGKLKASYKTKSGKPNVAKMRDRTATELRQRGSSGTRGTIAPLPRLIIGPQHSQLTPMPDLGRPTLKGSPSTPGMPPTEALRFPHPATQQRSMEMPSTGTRKRAVVRSKTPGGGGFASDAGGPKRMMLKAKTPGGGSVKGKATTPRGIANARAKGGKALAKGLSKRQRRI